MLYYRDMEGVERVQFITPYQSTLTQTEFNVGDVVQVVNYETDDYYYEDDEAEGEPSEDGYVDILFLHPDGTEEWVDGSRYFVPTSEPLSVTDTVIEKEYEKWEK